MIYNYHWLPGEDDGRMEESSESEDESRDTPDIDSYHSCLKKVYPGPYDRYERWGSGSYLEMVLRFLFISF